MNQQKILSALKRKMDEQGINCNELAKKAGVPCSTIYRALKGETPNVRPLTLKKMADALNCNIDEMLFE